MELQHRRWVGRLIRIGLVAVAIVVVLAWIQRRSPVRGDVRVQSEAPAVDGLGPGDMRILSRDSSVNLVLQGANVLAGLSPQMVAKVRTELEESAGRDTTGLGGSIAQMVKTTVAGHIGTHVVYPIRDIREIEYRDSQIVIVRNDGSRAELFGNIQKDNERLAKSFSPEDARRFVDAVRARKRELPPR